MRTTSPPGFLVLVTFTFLSACTQYTVGDRSFQDKAEALGAHGQELAVTLASVTATDTPVGGTLRMILPSRKRIADSGIVKQGEPAPEMMDYVATAESANFETMAAAVEKRQIFREVRIERSSSIGDPSSGGADFLLWLHQPRPAVAQWYLSEGSTKIRREVPLDLSKPAGPERTNAWLAALERVARRIQAKSK